MVVKLLKLLTTKMRVKGRVCISYCFDGKVFRKGEYEEMLRGEDIIDWEVMG